MTADAASRISGTPNHDPSARSAAHNSVIRVVAPALSFDGPHAYEPIRRFTNDCVDLEEAIRIVRRASVTARLNPDPDF